MDELGVPDGLALQFLRVGTEDLLKLDAICERHGKPAPTEIKMYYDARTGKFSAQYQYKKVRSGWKKISAGEMFDNWIAEMSK